MLLKDHRGFTLPELIVVMAIFLVVVMVTASAFKTIVSQVGQQSKSMQTQIGNIVGLELFRSDLQSAGYGLPWTFQANPLTTKYTEISDTDHDMPISATFWQDGMSPSSFNDSSPTTGAPPRAVQSGNTTFNLDSGVGSQYLVIKSMSLTNSATAKKWVSVTYTDAGKSESNWGAADRDFVKTSGATETVIVLRNTFVNGIPSRQLQVNGSSGIYSSRFANYTTLTLPHSSGDMFQVYGVDPTTDPRMPFNRADYYVRSPDKQPPSCAPSTGTLYKAIANQAAGAGFTELPLLDCVADMQVVYGIGPVGATDVNLHQTTLPGSAKDIREQLKEIRVYILTHEGKKDPGFTFPSNTIDVGEDFGGGLLGRTFRLNALIGAGWQNYRWKVYSIVVRPKNLIQ